MAARETKINNFQSRKGRNCRNEVIVIIGGGAAVPPGLEKFQGKLCFQGKRELLKNPE